MHELSEQLQQLELRMIEHEQQSIQLSKKLQALHDRTDEALKRSDQAFQKADRFLYQQRRQLDS
jgi:hypothetical protein